MKTAGLKGTPKGVWKAAGPNAEMVTVTTGFAVPIWSTRNSLTPMTQGKLISPRFAAQGDRQSQGCGMQCRPGPERWFSTVCNGKDSTRCVVFGHPKGVRATGQHIVVGCGLAQTVEQSKSNRWVAGSIPASAPKKLKPAPLVHYKMPSPGVLPGNSESQACC